MATTYLWGCGFDNGIPIPAADYKVGGLTTEPPRDTSVKKTGLASLKLTWGSSYCAWVRRALAVSQPAVSVDIHCGDNYNYVSTNKENVSPNVFFAMGEVYQLVARWNGYTHTMDLYERYVNPSTGAITNTWLKSGTVQVAQNDFFNFQMWVSSTTAYIKIDGHLSLSYDYGCPPGYSFQSCMLWGGGYQLGTGANCWYDNWTIGKDGWLGSIGVDELAPTANSTVQFTPLSGTNVDNVKDILPNDATYNYATVDGKYDEFEIEAFDEYTPEGILKQVVAVQARVRMKIDAATGDYAKAALVSNGKIEETQSPLLTAFNYITHISPTDPDTGSAWTPDAVRAALLRYEAVIA